MESVLLFRSHHALADGASIMLALSDLCDEAEEIRANIEVELKKWKRRGEKGPRKGFIRRMLLKLVRILSIFMWCSLGSLAAVLHQGYLQISTPTNPFDAVRAKAESIRARVIGTVHFLVRRRSVGGSQENCDGNRRSQRNGNNGERLVRELRNGSRHETAR